MGRPAHFAIIGLYKVLGECGMLAYLAYMAERLEECRRLLKPTGSIYYHCDPTASHYIKVLMDAVFGHRNFRNEIVWKRTNTHSDARRQYPDTSDVLLFYANASAGFARTVLPHDPEYVRSEYRFDDGDGRGRYRLDNMTSPKPRENMMYDWRGWPHPKNGWRYQRETMQRLHDEGRIHYPTAKDGSPDHSKRLMLKRYLSKQSGVVLGSVAVGDGGDHPLLQAGGDAPRPAVRRQDPERRDHRGHAPGRVGRAPDRVRTP